MMNDVTADNQALEARACRAVKKINCVARKSRWRRNTVDNRGGFQIIHIFSNTIVAGEKFNMSAEDVLTWCEGRS